MIVLQNTLPNPAVALAFHPRAQTLIGGGNGGFDVWDLTSSARTFIPSHAVDSLYGCVYEAGGRWVYVSDHRGGFRLLRPEGPLALRVPGSPHERHVTSFDVTPDGTRLVMARGGAGRNRVECWMLRPSGSFGAAWSLRDGVPIGPMEPYTLNESRWFTGAVAVRADGDVAAAENREGNGLAGEALVVLRGAYTGSTIAELGRSSTSFAARLAFGPDGRALFAWDEAGIERWDLAAGRRTARRKAPGRARLRGLAVHPSGRALITVGGDGRARTWDPLDLSPVGALNPGVGRLSSVAISPDGMLAAAGGDGGRVAVWDVES